MTVGAGFQNTLVFAANGDFSGNSPPALTNGLQTNGQLWIGATALNAGGTHINIGNIISPDGSITVGYTFPNITVVAHGAGFTWNDVSGPFSPLKNNGYFVTATATGTLPLAPAQGDTIEFFVDTTQILTIQAAGSHEIRIGTGVSSVAGTAKSNNRGDSIQLVFRAADNTWCCVSAPEGTWTLA